MATSLRTSILVLMLSLTGASLHAAYYRPEETIIRFFVNTWSDTGQEWAIKTAIASFLACEQV